MSNIEHFSIKNKIIGVGEPCFIIAEVAQAHDGSLGIAHSFIDALADTGVDAIKFQTHIANAEGTTDEEFRINFSYEDKSRYEYWQRMEFSEEQWKGLLDHAQDRGLVFLSSAFSEEAVSLLDRIGMPAWKVGSGEITNFHLIGRMLETGKPILLSSGMSSWEELDKTVEFIRHSANPLAVFQCTSKYPVTLEEVGLNIINDIQEKYSVASGISDHSGIIYPSLAAMATGSELLEVHVAFHKSMFGPDASSSLNLSEIRMLVEARDAFHRMRVNPVQKNDIYQNLSGMRSLFNKSIALKYQKSKGSIIRAEDLVLKKPGTGIPSNERENCIGKILINDVEASRLLKYEDFE